MRTKRAIGHLAVVFLIVSLAACYVVAQDDDGSEVEWTPERIEEDTPLNPGDKVRLSIESLSRAGYLYVIDRAQYADGTLGEPLLIFPTLRTSNKNRVKPGRLIYIPSVKG